MKKEEKQLIYTLLKTADAYESGYTRDKFKAEPVFEDDKDIATSSIQSHTILMAQIEEEKGAIEKSISKELHITEEEHSLVD